MPIRHSPGCNCCSGICPDCVGTIPEEFDITFSGLSNANCDLASEMVGSFTLTGPYYYTSEQFHWTILDGDEIPSGALGVCLWGYGFGVSGGGGVGGGVVYPSCTFPITENAPCTSTGNMTLYAYTLAKFTMPEGASNAYIWRLIITYNAALACSCAIWGQPADSCCTDSDFSRDNWWWEHSTSSNSCELAGDESWSANTPSFDFSVTCDAEAGGGDFILNETATFSTFFSGSLSLSSKPTSA